jgi:hypothetical protein
MKRERIYFILIILLFGCKHTLKNDFVNDTGKKANDLHVTYTGTGGSLKNEKVTPKGKTDIKQGNTINVKWENSSVLPGGKVTLEVDSDFESTTPYAVVWTRNGDTLSKNKE